MTTTKKNNPNANTSWEAGYATACQAVFDHGKAWASDNWIARVDCPDWNAGYRRALEVCK